VEVLQEGLYLQSQKTAELHQLLIDIMHEDNNGLKIKTNHNKHQQKKTEIREHADVPVQPTVLLVLRASFSFLWLTN